MLFRATVSETLRETLDSEKIKQEMGPSWCSLHSKIAVVTTVRVNARRVSSSPSPLAREELTCLAIKGAQSRRIRSRNGLTT